MILELKNINYKYKKGEMVLNDLSMSIQRGKLTAIAGPNGVGKSTVIKLMNGLLSPDSGQIYLDNKLIKDSKILTKRVGVVFQNPDEQVFFPNVEDDILFALRNRGVSKETLEEKLIDTLKTLKIEHLRQRNFFNLSFGEKKKVAFAGIFITHPDILVLDEPTIGIDPWVKEHFIQLILEMKKSATIVVATHDLDLLRVVDEIQLMSDGKIVGIYDTFNEFKQNMSIANIKK